MTGASTAKAGDIIACNRDGRTFFAVVESPGTDDILVTPLTKGATYYHVSSRDVKAIYRFAKGTRPLVTKTGAPAWGSQ